MSGVSKKALIIASACVLVIGAIICVITLGILGNTKDEKDNTSPAETTTTTVITTTVTTASETVTTPAPETDTTVTTALVVTTAPEQVTTTTVATTKATVKKTSTTTKKVTTTKKATTTTKPKPVTTTKKVTTTTTAKASTTTKKVTTTSPKITTKKATTTTPTAPEITDKNLYGYWCDVSDRMNDTIIDWEKVTLQIGIFIDDYPIDYKKMYNQGKKYANYSDIEKAAAVSKYAYEQGGRNCIEYALNAYFLAQGANLECYLAMSSDYGWYAHVCNVTKIDGKWYYMEPQINTVGAPNSFGYMEYTDEDGNTVRPYPHGFDIRFDIYDNKVNITISDTWYGE